MIGNQEPRLKVVPDGDEHPRWPQVLALLAELGIVLDPWQLMVLWTSLLRRGAFWAAFAVACCVPRQNGKDEILLARALIGPTILDERFVIHSAHLADTAKEGFHRLVDVIDTHEAWKARNVKAIRYTNGFEQVVFRNGNRIRFRTRSGTRGGGRGLSGSPVFFNEPMFLPEVAMGSILPVLSAQPDPQVWYTGSAVDQAIHADGVVFARVRERALAGDDDRLAYFEWSLDKDSPEDVTLEDAADPKNHAATNPAYGVRITPDYVVAELGELDLRTAAVERLGVGDWPNPGLQTVIDLNLWRSLKDAESQTTGPVAFTFDTRPDRGKSVIAAVGRRDDGQLHVEIVDQREGVAWLVPELARLDLEHMPLGIVCDGQGPAASLVPELKMRNVDVTVLTAPQYAEACGMLYDEIAESRLRHLGSEDLESAIRGAAQRPLGDRWAWSRRNSKSDISPLVACTIGVWLVVTEERNAPLFAFG